MFNFLKKIFSIFLIFNLTFVSSAQAAAAATFDNINGDGTGFDTSPAGDGIAFNNDGTKMFLTNDDDADSDIKVFTLTTGFDLSTATLSGTTFDISNEGQSPAGIAFNNDGTRMFVVDNTGSAREINEYTLSVGFDLTSTVNHVDINSDDTGFNVSAQQAMPTDITFNNDGTKMFLVGLAHDEVDIYTLTTGFDLSTATFVDINGNGTGFDISDQETAVTSVKFNNDGTRMFVVGATGDDVNEYTLSVGFDLTSTVTFVDSFDISGQDTNPRSMTFNNTGTKMFVVSNVDGEINSYTLFCPFAVTNSSKCEEPTQDLSLIHI